jgi:hypothetical protein
MELFHLLGEDDMRHNARFWVWWNDGWVKLTLMPGQTLAVGYGGPCEEGWSRYSEQWSHVGDRVEREWVSEGRDCDGRLSQYGEDFAWLSELASVGRGEFEEMLAPRWHDSQSSQRDEFAELAGY